MANVLGKARTKTASYNTQKSNSMHYLIAIIRIMKCNNEVFLA